MSQEVLKPSVGGNLGFPPCFQYSTLRDSSDTEQRVKNKTNNRICWCVVILTVCVLALCCVCISLTAYALSAVKVVEARLVTLEEDLARVTGKYESMLLQQEQQQQQQQQQQPQQQQQQSVTSHESSTQTETFHNARRRKRTTSRQTTTGFVHLVGKSAPDSTTEVGDTTVFKWQKSDHHRRLQGLNLLPNHQDISSIKILTSGVYLVYSQVAVHGQENENINFYCSHKMVQKKGNGETKHILASLLTQDNRGRVYSDMVPADLRPLDTKLHMGVFFLLPDDELSVQIPTLCTNTRYSMSNENSYFGVVKIG